MRLQNRLALVVAASAAIAILLAASGFWFVAVQEQRSQLDESLLATVRQPRQLVAEIREDAGRARFGARGGFQDFLEPLPGDDRIFTRVQVTLDGGPVLIDQGLPAAAAVGDEAQIETVEIDGERFRIATARTGPNGDVIVQLGRNIEDLEDGLTRLRNRIIFGSLLGVGLAWVLGALVARPLSAPIAAVSEAAKSMALRPDLPSRIDVDRNDEVGDLATSFNQMLAALEVSREQQKRLVADASHELRTPLTSLRLKIDLLDSSPDLAAEQRQELLAGSAAELERLTDLVGELVSLASDPTAADESATPGQIGPLASEVARMVQQRTGRTVEVEIGEDPVIVLRQAMVQRAISNLVDNAAKYSDPPAPIRVVVNGGSVEVQDRGEGIPEEDLPLVFERFYRSPTARTRPGNGIGLAIVSRVALLHGGQTWARNGDDGGAIVGFSIASDPSA